MKIDRARGIVRASQFQSGDPAAKRDYRPGRAPFVYFINSGDFVKIGWATDVSERLRTCQTGNPILLELAAAFVGGPSEEALLHLAFRSQHVRAEWFRCEGAISEIIKALRDKDPYEARIWVGKWYQVEHGHSGLLAPEWMRDRRLAHEV